MRDIVKELFYGLAGISLGSGFLFKIADEYSKIAAALRLRDLGECETAKDRLFCIKLHEISCSIPQKTSIQPVAINPFRRVIIILRMGVKNLLGKIFT